jgi:uncharacterized protein (TIGR03437 family)
MSRDWARTGAMLAAFGVTAIALPAQDDVTVREIRSGFPEHPSGLASDSGFLYMTGGVFPSVSVAPGSPTPGFLRKTDAAGNEQWVRRFTPSTIVLRPHGVAVLDGAIYVAGYGGGDFSTSVRASAFLRKYDATGTELWFRQFSSGRDTGAFGVAVDSTGVYISGEADALEAAHSPLTSAGTFVRKYSHSGEVLWTRQITVPGSYGFAGAIAASGRLVFATGAAKDGGALRCYDPDGAELWTASLNSIVDPDATLVVDGKGLYLAHAGVLSKYALDGSHLWDSRFSDLGSAVSTYAGVAYVAGISLTPKPGQCAYGRGDAVAAAYDGEGRLLWRRVFGAADSERATAIVAGENGIFVAGTAQHQSPAPVAFLARVNENQTGPAMAPKIVGECIANAASYEASGVAAGEIIVVLGSRVGPDRLTPGVIENGHLPIELAETRVLFDNNPVPLVYASDRQTSAIVPSGLALTNNTVVEVEYRGVRSNALTVPIVPARPGLFTADSSGFGQAAVVNEDGTVNSPSNPAPRGSIVALYGTGGGWTDHYGLEGTIVGTSPPQLVEHVAAELSSAVPEDGADAVEAEVVYAGAAPGFVQGAMQINIRIPAAAAVGDKVPLWVQIGSASTQPGITIAVR